VRRLYISHEKKVVEAPVHVPNLNLRFPNISYFSGGVRRLYSSQKKRKVVGAPVQER